MVRPRPLSPRWPPPRPRTQTSLREGCNQILRSDCRHLMAKLYDSTRRALPYVYVHRQGPAGEPGQWFRCVG